MGLLISRFRRKKSTRQSLEELDGRINKLERDGHSTEQRRRRALALLLAMSVGLYVIALLLFYFYWRPSGWREGVVYCTPLLVFPLVIVLLRSGLARYYNWKLMRSKNKLLDMRAEKKRILEEVMDKETYKVAKEILDKFGEKTENNLSPNTTIARVAGPVGNQALPVANVIGTPAQLRQRQPLVGSPGSPMQRQLLPPAGTLVVAPNQMTPLKSDSLPRPLMGGGGAFDRLVDYLVGDGPGSRYALICSHCKGHNGMALPEEFEYVSFRCAYCRFPNAARKQRPRPPPLTPSKGPIQQGTNVSSDSSESDEPAESPSNTGSTDVVAGPASSVEAESASDTEKDTATEEITQEVKTQEAKKTD